MIGPRAALWGALLGVNASVPACLAQTGALPLQLAPRPTSPEISASDLMTRIYIMADDSMEGRKSFTPGNVKGTAYLAAELRKLGLEPAGVNGTYFQTLPPDSSKGNAPARNVIAILRGTDPKLRQTYVATPTASVVS